LIGLAAVLYVFLRVWQLDEVSMWRDEYFTMLAVRRDWIGMMAFVVRDVVHPPLFYLLLNGWVAVGGEAVVWARLLPVLISIATIVPLLLLSWEIKFGGAETGVGLLFLAVNNYLVAYARELRMYSLLLFLTTCSLWLFARYVNAGGGRGRRLWTLFGVNLLLVYTHYYGWLVVGIEVLFLLFRGRRRWRPFAASCVLLVLCFAPWATAVARAAIEKRGLEENLGWIAPPVLFDVAWYYAVLNGPQSFPRSTLLGLLLFGLPIVVWGVRLVGKHAQAEGSPRQLFVWFCLFAFLPVAIVFVASRLFAQSGWGPRYLIIASVPYLLLVSAAANQIRPRPLRVVAIAVLVAWAGLSGFSGQDKKQEEDIDWSPLVRQVAAAEPDSAHDVLVYIWGDFLLRPLQYHLGPAGPSAFNVKPVDRLTEVARHRGGHFWFGYRVRDWVHARTPQDVFAARGFSVGKPLSAGEGDARIILFRVRTHSNGANPGESGASRDTGAH
jgi:4-amino-4-deoxy-L-arabinose transferase-like glycosyltransferase